MATWAKENVPLIQLANWTTGANDTTSYTILLQPKNQTYPTGGISCSQCSTTTYRWRPDSDLDSGIDYWIYINAVIKGTLTARDGVSGIAGGD